MAPARAGECEVKYLGQCRGNAMSKTALVVSAHPGDFVWRAGGAIALHAKNGYRVKIVCLAFGGRGGARPRRAGGGDRILRCRRLSAAPRRCAYGSSDRYLSRAQPEFCPDA